MRSFYKIQGIPTLADNNMMLQRLPNHDEVWGPTAIQLPFYTLKNHCMIVWRAFVDSNRSREFDGLI